MDRVYKDYLHRAQGVQLDLEGTQDNLYKQLRVQSAPNAAKEKNSFEQSTLGSLLA